MVGESDGGPEAPGGGDAPPARPRRGLRLSLVWSASNLLLMGLMVWFWMTPLPWEPHPTMSPAPTATDIPLQLLTATPGFALTVTPGPAATFTSTPTHAGGSGGAQPTATPIPPTPTSQPTATPIPPTPTIHVTPGPQN